jgi:hypothetical protein
VWPGNLDLAQLTATRLSIVRSRVDEEGQNPDLWDVLGLRLALKRRYFNYILRSLEVEVLRLFFPVDQ